MFNAPMNHFSTNCSASPFKLARAVVGKETQIKSTRLWSAWRPCSSSFLAREIKQTFGDRGREIVRKSAAGYGRFRGTEIRRRVEKLGLPLDIPTMWDWWDLPVTSSRAEERMNDDLNPYYHAFEVPVCPFNDIYQIHYPSDLMALHCESMHEAAFKGFNPAIDFWMPSLMPRGEGRCIFRMRIQDDEAERIEQRKTGAVSPVRGLDDMVTCL